jgi:hypothetical protein
VTSIEEVNHPADDPWFCQVKRRRLQTWSRGVSAETLRLMNIRFRPYNSPSACTSRIFSYTEKSVSSLLKPCEISRCNFLYKNITRKLHIERIAANALWIFISICPLLKTESLSIGTKLSLHKALIRSTLTSAFPATFWKGSVCETYEGVTKSFRTESVKKYTLTTINTKGYGGKTHYTDSQNSDTTAPSGRELYHLQFSLQVASPETFGYTLVVLRTQW